MMALGLTYPEASYQGAAQGVTLFLTVLVPYLLPFITLSKVFIRSLTSRNKQMSSFWLYGLAAIGGYPNGALLVKQAMLQGRVKAPSLLFAALQFPSPMFLIAFVGVSLLHNQLMGILLYGAIHCINIAFFLYWKLSNDQPVSSRPISRVKAASFFGSITETLTIIAVSVIVSSAIAEIVIQSLTLPPYLGALLYGMLELSAGMGQLASLDAPLVYYGIVLGFSSLSIHLQNFLLVRGSGISFGPYWLSRIVTVAVLAWLLLMLD